jgi:hypothetical protein
MIQQYHSSGYTWRNVLKLLQKHLHIHVYCITIYNNQAMETTKMPHNRWMNPENVVFIYNGILTTKKNEILPFTRKWMELDNIILSDVS